MKGRVVKVRDLSPAEVDAWQELGQNVIAPNPVLEPGCLIPAARFLPNGSEIYLAFAEEDGKFFGCFPLVRARRGNDRMPLTLIEHLLLTGTTQVRRNRYDLTPLLRSERSDEAMGSLLQAVRDCRFPNAPKLLRFEALCAGGPVESSLRNAAQALHIPLYVAESWTRPVANRRPEGDYLQGSATRRKNVKELLRKKKRLGELLGGKVTLVDRSADSEAIEEIFRLERSGYKLATGIATESWCGEPEWFRAMCDEFRREGRLVVSTLEAGGTTAAILVMLRGGDRLLGLQRAYDEQLKQYSPGGQLDLLFFDHFHRMNGMQILDSCTGANNEKAVPLFVDSQPVITIVAAIGGRWDGLLLTAFGFLRDHLQLRKRLLRLMGKYSWIDQLARRIAARLELPANLQKPGLFNPDSAVAV
ncbi:MAG TPA: GNAT family N-acetyltransferase [Acidimicrobiales bacterium]|nr:GNAT family N-acetyltransferase [Acidimicrobiales bacterium]